MKQSAQRSPGRVRSDASRVAILNSTLKLLETQSLQQLSIEAIAREAGVGKTTIYRWWPSKAAVVIEAFLINHTSHVKPPKDLSPGAALIKIVQLLIKEYEGWEGRIVSQILGEGQSDPEILREFRERFWIDRRNLTMALVLEARERGELRDDVPAEFLLELLFAPIYFRLMTGWAPLSKDFSKSYTENIMRLLEPTAVPVAPKKPARKTSRS